MPAPAYEGTYSQDEMRGMIRHERKIELAWECNRYFDVRRWFTAHGPDGEFNHDEYGLDMSRGTGAPTGVLHPDQGGNQGCFDIQHYFLPIKFFGDHAQYAAGAGALLLMAAAGHMLNLKMENSL